MTNSEEHELHVLNELIVATLDSASGYQRVGDVIGGRYGSVFEQHASVRRYVADQLEDQVRSLGGKPAHQRSILAEAHRVVTTSDHASSVEGVGANSTALREAIDRSEAKLARQFEAALESQRLSDPNRDLVHKGYRLVKSGHDQAWDLLKHHLVQH